jgi:hypothetical protein
MSPAAIAFQRKRDPASEVRRGLASATNRTTPAAEAE